MPFNGSNRIEALFAFVDQYVAGDPAMRSGFDQVFGDVVTSVNAAIAYLEGLTATGTDQRYLGRVVAVPTERNDTTPLEAGDFYVAGHVDAGRVGLTYVYNGSAFVVASDFTSIGSFFKDTLSAAGTPAVARSALELGSAATQNATAFAAASVATDVALAIKLLTDGIAKSMSANDWNNAHLAGPGTTMVQANSAATNAPVAANMSGLYIAYDANNGFLVAAAHGAETIYYRMRSATSWGNWHRAPQRDTVISGLSINTTLSDTPGADLLRIGSGVTDLPSGSVEGDLLVTSVYDASNASQWILSKTGAMFLRGRSGGVSGAWRSISQRVLLATKVAAASAQIDFTEFNNAIYEDYEWDLVGIIPGTNATSLRMLFSSNGGAAYDNAAANYYQSSPYMEDITDPANDGGSLAQVVLSNNSRTVGNAGGRLGVRGKVWMRNAGVAGLYTEVDFDTTYESSTGTYVRTWGAAKRTLAQDTDAVRFIQSAGTISGTFRMWGHTKG